MISDDYRISTLNIVDMLDIMELSKINNGSPYTMITRLIEKNIEFLRSARGSAPFLKISSQICFRKHSSSRLSDFAIVIGLSRD